MTLFYYLICLMILGFGAIALILFIEKNKESALNKESKPQKPSQESVPPQKLLDRLHLEPETQKAPTRESLSLLLNSVKNHPPSPEIEPQNTTESELSACADDCRLMMMSSNVMMVFIVSS